MKDSRLHSRKNLEKYDIFPKNSNSNRNCVLKNISSVIRIIGGKDLFDDTRVHPDS